MACWNLDNGKCRVTDRPCDSNEYACPIAKDERRVAYFSSRNSSGGIWSIIGGIVVLVLLISCIGECAGCC